jgi:hypothetical protein
MVKAIMNGRATKIIDLPRLICGASGDGDRKRTRCGLAAMPRMSACGALPSLVRVPMNVCLQKM